MKYSFHLDSTWSLLVTSWPFVARHISTAGSNDFSCIVEAHIKFAGVLNTQFRLKSDRRVTLFHSKQILFPSLFLLVFIHCREQCSSGSVLNLDHPRSCAVLFVINRGTLLVKPLLVLLFSRVNNGSGGGYLLYFFCSFIPKFIEAACLNVVHTLKFGHQLVAILR
jgi:hypothetical protein